MKKFFKKMADEIKLRLQLFAANTNVTTDTGMATEGIDKEFYKTKLLKFAEPELVFSRFGKKINIPQGTGNTIEFRYMDPLPVITQDLTEGVTPNGRKAVFRKITEELHQIGDWISVSDKLQLEAIDPIVSEITGAQGRQAGKSFDTLVRDVVSAGTNVLYSPNYNAATGVYTENVARATMDATAKISVDTLMNAAAILEGQDAPTIDGEYISVMHPYVACDLEKSPEWQDLQRYVHPEKIYKGEIGSVGNIRVIKNTRSKIWANAASSTLSVYATMIFGQDAYAVTELEGAGLEHIVKPLGAGDDPLNQRASVGWKGFRLAKILIQPYLLRIESTCGTMPTAAAN